ncbi:MAG: Hsp70 family protein [Candidatus Thiodiazotropha sp. (ex Lucinoma borealis)]|nr:Hsp70 family protein [Candidatus Thiodiazotropha sp. (ex Lucinoma borealis)]
MTSTNSHLWLGIDLGTCNSSAAIKLSPDSVETICSSDSGTHSTTFLDESEGHKNFPSFILFDTEGNLKSVGMSGKKIAHLYPQRVVWGIKRLLGKTYTDLKGSGELVRFPFQIRPDRKNGQCQVVIGETRYTPEDLCSAIFRKIKTDAEQQTNTQLDSVVVSVPAYYDPLRVSPIIEAARAAGFLHIKTIPEPVAAALAYDVEITTRPVKVVVFDLGAGTLDVTAGLLFRHPDDASEYKFEVVKNTGDTRLGGMDMDDRLIRLISDKCGLAVLDKGDAAKLRRHAELAKIQLSMKDACELSFTLQEHEHRCSITQLELASVLEGTSNEKNLLEDARHQVMAAIDEAGWQPMDVERLILIGGPTRLPCIRDMLRIVFNSNPAVLEQITAFYSGDETIDRMSAVAMGAALSIDRRVQDKVPAGYGFEDIDIDSEVMVHTPNILVPRDSGYPWRSQHQVIRWTNGSGLFEFKILQQLPESEKEQFGYEYKFVGIQKFAVKNPEFCMVSIQMGYNANKELEVTFTNIFTGETATYQGVIQSACIGMKYPLTVKRPPDISRKQMHRVAPDENTLHEFIKWAAVTSGYIQRKTDNYPMPHMALAQKLDELGALLRKGNAEARYEAVFTQLHSLIWNANSAGILNQDEYIELTNHITSFESKLFQVAAA